MSRPLFLILEALWCALLGFLIGWSMGKRRVYSVPLKVLKKGGKSTTAQVDVVSENPAEYNVVWEGLLNGTKRVRVSANSISMPEELVPSVKQNSSKCSITFLHNNPHIFALTAEVNSVDNGCYMCKVNPILVLFSLSGMLITLILAVTTSKNFYSFDAATFIFSWFSSIWNGFALTVQKMDDSEKYIHKDAVVKEIDSKEQPLVSIASPISFGPPSNAAQPAVSAAAPFSSSVAPSAPPPQSISQEQLAMVNLPPGMTAERAEAALMEAAIAASMQQTEVAPANPAYEPGMSNIYNEGPQTSEGVVRGTAEVSAPVYIADAPPEYEAPPAYGEY